MKTRLLLASGNQGKCAELTRLLATEKIELLAPDDLALSGLEVAETGLSFWENARLKARAYAQAAGIPALADDSGLCVEALGGEPGLHSARFGGPGLDDRGRRLHLLLKLSALTDIHERNAEFRCVLCISAPDGTILCESEGRCSGHIATVEQKGRQGFGYDPLFIPLGFKPSFAQLDDAIKDRISHRGRAIAALWPKLNQWLASETETK